MAGTEHLMGGHLTVRIVTPEATAYEGKADLVVVPSHDGETAFLPGHAAFVGLLGAGECRFHVPDGGTHHFFLAGGVAQVVDDVVTVLAETVIPAASLDAAKVEREFEAASAMPASDPALSAVREKALLAARAKRRLIARLASLPGAHH